MFDGWMTQKVYHAAFDHIARKFFTLDNYYTLPTKQADGTVRRQQRLFRLDFPQPISAVSCFMWNSTHAHTKRKARVVSQVKDCAVFAFYILGAKKTASFVHT
jgi:hypothetical protein